MRSFLFVLLALVCLLAGPGLLRFDAPTADAEEVLKPTKAYSAYLKEMRRVHPSEKAEEGKRRALAYLEAWEGTGKKATGSQRYALAQFQQLAERYKDAWLGFQTVSQNTELKPKTRGYGASAEAGVLLVAEMRESIGHEAVSSAIERLEKFANTMTSDAQASTQGKLYAALARLHDYAGRYKRAIEIRMQLIENDPGKLERLLRPIVWGLRDSTHKMDGYDAMRAQAKSVMKTLKELQSQKISQTKSKLGQMRDKLKAIMPDALGPDGRLKKDNPREMSGGERAVYTAQRQYDGATELMATIKGCEGGFAVMGTPAPEWTLGKEYGEVKSLADVKGKVVVLDFWLTSGQRSNFGVMRDLMRAYAEKGLVVVGVTATSHVCYETRWDIDEDYAHKVVPGQRKQYAARLASEENPANESHAIYNEDKYIELEERVVESFIGQHELKWPHVLIDEAEPEEKYGLEGWPHAVILDRQGRIRYMTATTLTRDKKEVVAAIRKVVEDLLAEGS